MKLLLPVFLSLLWGFSGPASAQDPVGPTPEDRRLRTDRLAAEGHCRAKRQAYDRAQTALDKALATETTPETSIYFRAQELERARENYCLCLAQMWNSVHGLKALPKEWNEFCDPQPPFDIEAERIRRGIGNPLRRGVPPQPGAPPDMSDVPPPCTEKYEAYEESRKEFQEGARGGKKEERGVRPDRKQLRDRMVSTYRSLCDCWKDMATYLYEEYCTWSGQGAPPDLSPVGRGPATGATPPGKRIPDVPLPEPPRPVSPVSPGSGPAPPAPGMPAPPAPGAPAADCLREGAWNVAFTVEQHNDNHDHTVCVKFLRRLLKMTLGDFLGDLFAARFEDLLPQMECTKLPGCGGTCKGTLGQFAGKQDVQFEIQDLRRNGDTITGRLVITSGGEILFILRFTATPVTA